MWSCVILEWPYWVLVLKIHQLCRSINPVLYELVIEVELSGMWFNLSKGYYFMEIYLVAEQRICVNHCSCLYIKTILLVLWNVFFWVANMHTVFTIVPGTHSFVLMLGYHYSESFWYKRLSKWYVSVLVYVK